MILVQFNENYHKRVVFAKIFGLNSNELFQSFSFGIIFDIFFTDENLEFFIRSFGRILNLNLNY